MIIKLGGIPIYFITHVISAHFTYLTHAI